MKITLLEDTKAQSEAGSSEEKVFAVEDQVCEVATTEAENENDEIVNDVGEHINEQCTSSAEAVDGIVVAKEQQTTEDIITDDIFLTQTEINVLEQRRDKFFNTPITDRNIAQYEIIIEKEIEALNLVYQRHKVEGQVTFTDVANEILTSVKQFVSSLCLDLLSNRPFELKYWNQYEYFCTQFNVQFTDERRKAFESILEEANSMTNGDAVEIYCNVASCEHNISNDYKYTKHLLTQGLFRHSSSVKLYLTLLQLQIGECYMLEQGEAPSDEEMSIMKGEHIQRTYEQFKKHVALNESNIEQLVALVETNLQTCPCAPVIQFKDSVLEDAKRKAPNSIATLDMNIKSHLYGMDKDNIYKKLLNVFQLYWKAFLDHDKNPLIFHRMIDTFCSIQFNSTTIRKIVYLILDMGLHYKVLTPKHIEYYFNQLALENNDCAVTKTKLIYRDLKLDVRLDSKEETWKVKFATFLNLYGFDLARLDLLMNKTNKSLNKDSMVSVCLHTFSLLAASHDNPAAINFVVKMFSNLRKMFKEQNGKSNKEGETYKKLRLVLANWLVISRHRYSIVKPEYLELEKLGKHIIEKDSPSKHSSESDCLHKLLGRLLQCKMSDEETTLSVTEKT